MTDNNLEFQTTKSEFSASQSYLIVTGAFLSLVAVGLVLASFGVFLKPISTYFGWTRAQISLAATIASVVGGVTGIIAGRLSDRFSPRLITTICGVFAGSACLLLSRINALWQLYLCYGLLVGISMANVVPTVSLVTRCFKKKSGWLMGISLAGGAIGSIVAAPVITKLIDLYNWRTAYLLVGITVLIFITISLILLRDPPRIKHSIQNQNSSSKETAPSNPGISLGRAVHYRVFWILVIIFLSSILTQQVISVHIIPHATDVGISPIMAATVVSVIYGVNCVGNLTGGRIVDIIGSRLAMIFGLSLLLVSLLIILIANQAWMFFAFAIFFGLAWGAIITLRFSMISEFFGLQSLGAITGAFMLILNLGSAASPVIAGYIFDVTGSYRLGFLILTAICVFGLLIAVMLKLRADRYPSSIHN